MTAVNVGYVKKHKLGLRQNVAGLVNIYVRPQKDDNFNFNSRSQAQNRLKWRRYGVAEIGRINQKTVEFPFKSFIHLGIFSSHKFLIHIFIHRFHSQKSNDEAPVKGCRIMRMKYSTRWNATLNEFYSSSVVLSIVTATSHLVQFRRDVLGSRKQQFESNISWVSGLDVALPLIKCHNINSS